MDQVTKSLQALPGVDSAYVWLPPGTASVVYHDAYTNPDKMCSAVAACGLLHDSRCCAGGVRRPQTRLYIA